ncbi:hemolysin-iii channel protein izh2 [Moniliophthora roreri MCA 2997]|uniref:Hemolysin-iii channel protein izh2 n=1 Tax=Moniliophthora roreri (strain MCA 2997) TaxID=1381753 RepID=V2YSS6_MONRO|nr:hemolysin-iii channel protein izh2 [Moniliophthora roreri MCA 2997]KAI3614888.1 hemolysin-iii channel protein izh2 [Moniliophthora roreri]
MSSLRNRFSEDKDLGKPHASMVPRNKSTTVSWQHLEEWQKDNQYILTGYRRVQYHWKGCFESIYGYLHNETVNIHSHLWGGVLYLCMFFIVRPSQLTPHQATWLDTTLFATFFFSAAFCHFSSALFHTSMCHSQEVESRVHACDYLGIIVLNLGSHYPLLYYGYFCEPEYRMWSIVIITVLGLAAGFVVLDPEYTKPTHIGTRTTIFLALGFYSLLPICHWLVIHGATVTLNDTGVKWFLLSGSFYVGGALLYANRVPERFRPGKFDYFFASHQIFHVCVVVGAYLHYVFISIALDHFHGQLECRI